MPTYAVLGSGGWGTAIAVMLAHKPGNVVRLWCAHASTATELREQRENTRQLAGVPIPDSVEITTDPGAAVANADCWIVAIPTAFLRATIAPFQGLAKPGIPVVSLTKGIEIHTFQRPTEILAAVLGTHDLVVLSGPSHAEEVARGKPTSVVAASCHAALAGWVQDQLGGSRLRIYTNTDVVGVELAGALKNVIGIAAGICDGLKFGDNAKAALVTRGLVEMTRFSVAHGADPATFMGMAGLGDLITTCFSLHGRNRGVGEQLARGAATMAEVMARPQVAEGVYTSKSVYHRVCEMGIEMPIMTGVYQVLYEGKSPPEAVKELLARQQRGENTFLG